MIARFMSFYKPGVTGIEGDAAVAAMEQADTAIEGSVLRPIPNRSSLWMVRVASSGFDSDSEAA